MMLWPVKDEGVLVRVFAREMFLFDPRAFARNHAQLIANSFQASDIYFISDSDDLFGVSLTPLGKDVGWHLDQRPASPEQIAQWLLLYDSPANDLVAGTKIRWHFAPVTESKWRTRERGADLLVRRAAVARERQRVLRTISGLPGGSLTALIYSSALATGQLKLSRLHRRRFLILVPRDLAVGGIPPKPMLDLAFLQWVLDAHIAPWGRDGDGSAEATTLAKFDSMVPLTLTSVGGDTWVVKWTGCLRRQLSVETSRGITAKIVGGPIPSGRHVVCIVDEMLLARTVEHRGARSGLRGTSVLGRTSPAGVLSVDRHSDNEAT
jgi:hypothetical protein